MKAYSEEYLNDVVENQGKLFDLVSQQYPAMDTEEFINSYMISKTRKSIDEAQAYVNTMDAKELLSYFSKTENYQMKEGKALEGFMPFWIVGKIFPKCGFTEAIERNREGCPC